MLEMINNQYILYLVRPTECKVYNYSIYLINLHYTKDYHESVNY
ncbi:hypothetical protein LX66_3692 [Chitinophaga japonensis]|uniref:Uncharacterized protein n=1 Tax=Chitinophaga japonensis TaxID=104662 RepID=A0A562SYM6_CHIJA|nr:hypothetical protein LX66_3692 [Chitinophaga japonensis]